MITFEKAMECAKKELAACVYQSETSPYPGVVAINNGRAEWLSRLIQAAEGAEKLQKELTAAKQKISVETPLGRLEACVGGDPEGYPEIFTYLVRKDGVEVDLVACEVNIEKDEARAYLYGDTRTESWTKHHAWPKSEINIDMKQGEMK